MRPLWASTVAAATLVMAACDGGHGPAADAPPSRVPGTDAWPGDRAAAGRSGHDATAGPTDGPADRFGHEGGEARALQAVGELLLADGRVERAYRVHFVNASAARHAAVAELRRAPPGTEIVQGRIEVGDLAPGERVVPRSTVTLRHAPGRVPRAHDLEWHWHEDATAEARRGRLLRGEAGTPATAALDGYEAERPDGAAMPARWTAVLQAAATVGAVNDALRGAQLRIVAMRPGNHTLTLSGPTLDTRRHSRMAQQLVDSGAFVRVDLLPAIAPSTASGGPGLDGLGAAAAAAADAAADDACED